MERVLYQILSTQRAKRAGNYRIVYDWIGSDADDIALLCNRFNTTTMKILNSYAGIGGNRKLWGNEHEITAVELDADIAKAYKTLFPNDTVIVTDAHQYLLDHYKEFDFIWTSPPCQTHSRTNYFTQSIRKKASYPDMKLWQEIIYLNQFCKSLFVVENVIPYYDQFFPKYTKIGRHFLWSNFNIPIIKMPKNEIGTMMKEYVGTGKHAHDKKLVDRNSVNSELGLHILNCALNIETVKQLNLFQ